MSVQPYLFFEGRAEEAANFYKAAIGAEVTMLMRFREAPDAPPPGVLPPGNGDKVMHMALLVGGTTVFLSDGGCSGKANFGGFSLSLTMPDAAAADRAFAALGEGGTVQMPIGKTFFSPCFGMVQDRFGLSWMIIVPMG